MKISQSPIPLPKPNTVNHFGLSNSSWYKKACVPLVIVNFIETALEIFQRISKMVLCCDHSVVVFSTVVLDQKAISPGACLYQESLFGNSPPIAVEDAENISKDRYKSMLENLIQLFKDSHLSWIKQGEVFLVFLQHLLDNMVAFPITIYHLKKSGDYNDVKSRVTEVLKYASACMACLDWQKEAGWPLFAMPFAGIAFQIKRYVTFMTEFMMYGIATSDPLNPAMRELQQWRKSHALEHAYFFQYLTKSPHTRSLGRRSMTSATRLRMLMLLWRGVRILMVVTHTTQQIYL